MHSQKDLGVEDILRAYLKCPSFTNTKGENSVPGFLSSLFSSFPYFQKNPRLFGSHALPGDPLGRSVFYACIRGSSPNCVILMHHYDIVSLDDYTNLAPLAFDPEALEEGLLRIKGSLPEDVQACLQSGEYLFARGAADMKGGGAAQIALMKYFSESPDFSASLVLLAVPDEENLSAGMREGVGLLKKLQKEEGFVYKLMIGSEPCEPCEPREASGLQVRRISFGSIGKIMPFVHAKGISCHAGAVFDGFNPLGLLGAIVSACEAEMSFSESIGGEKSPPPTWLYLNSHKKGYDVSLPRSATGCLSVLTFKQSPKEVMSLLYKICSQTAEAYCRRLDKNRRLFGGKGKAPEAEILFFDEALASLPPEGLDAYKNYRQGLKKELEQGSIHALEASALCADFLSSRLPPRPMLILGIAPPFYPGVYTDSQSLLKDLQAYAEEENLGACSPEAYYPFISDLSYASSEENSFEGLMPLYGSGYSLPQTLPVPAVNIGPIGFDLHRIGERVHKKDLFYNLPRLLYKTIKLTLN